MKNPRSFVPRQRRQEQQRAGRGPPGAPIKERESSVDLAIASPGGGTASRECGSRKQKRLPRPSHRIAAIERGDARDRKNKEIPVPEERAPARPAERGDPLLERESRRRRPSGVVGRRRMLPCRSPSLRGDYATLGPSTAVRGRVSLAARAKGRERVASCRKTYLVLLFDERNELKKKRVGLAFAVARVQNRFFFLDSLLPFTTRLSLCPAEASLALWLLSLSCARGVALFCESASGPPSRACA